MTTPESYKNSGTCRSCGATGSHKCPGLQFSPSVEKNPLAELSRRLEEKLTAVSAEMDMADYQHVLTSASYEFDAGFTAGLRYAITEITSKLTKNPDE